MGAYRTPFQPILMECGSYKDSSCSPRFSGAGQGGLDVTVLWKDLTGFLFWLFLSARTPQKPLNGGPEMLENKLALLSFQAARLRRRLGCCRWRHRKVRVMSAPCRDSAGKVTPQIKHQARGEERGNRGGVAQSLGRLQLLSLSPAANSCQGSQAPPSGQ